MESFTSESLNQDLSNQPFFIELRQFLVKEFSAETIFLYGSYARGDFTEQSDIDLAVITSDCQLKNYSNTFKGKKLDVWFYQWSQLDPQDPQFLRLANSQLLLDSKGQGQIFKNSIKKTLTEGPTPLEANHRQHTLDWIEQMIRRAQEGDIEGNFRRTWLPVALLEIYFQLRNEWYLGSKQSFNWLQENDTEGFSLFNAAFLTPNDLDAIKRLAHHVVNIDLAD